MARSNADWQCREPLHKRTNTSSILATPPSTAHRVWALRDPTVRLEQGLPSSAADNIVTKRVPLDQEL